MPQLSFARAQRSVDCRYKKTWRNIDLMKKRVDASERQGYSSRFMQKTSLLLLTILIPVLAFAAPTSIRESAGSSRVDRGAISPIASLEALSSSALLFDISSTSTPVAIAASTSTPPAIPVAGEQTKPAKPISASKEITSTARQPLATKSVPDRLVPVQLRVPSAGIDAPIEALGLTANGEMAVPSGASGNVGWYQYGPVPGSAGSAVLDAHVFAAFANLKAVGAGDDIYVDMSDGSVRHFRVSETQVFALSSLSPSQLFRQTSRADLNLITCAGSLTSDKSTYTHRLIVYSTLALE